MQIECESSGPALDITAISEFQKTFGIHLPPIYQDFLLKYNGGTPVKRYFPISGFEDPVGGIQIFFGLNTTIKTANLDWRIRNRIAPFPNNMLEIACTGGNDLVCINTQTPGAPVYFYDQRPSWGNGIWRNEDLYIVAASFSEFLEKLQLEIKDFLP